MATPTNVLGGPLRPCCTDPMTGFYRDGYCRTGAEDRGLHTVCAEMTDAFLAFSASRGNDLSTPRPEFAFPGLQEGDRWCLCVERCRKPNLLVTTIHRPTWDGAQSVIVVDISNDGGSAAPASTAELVDYQFPPGVAGVAVPPIAAGGTVSVVFTLPYWVYDPDASLIVSVDAKGEIDECNEDDNRLRFFEPG